MEGKLFGRKEINIHMQGSSYKNSSGSELIFTNSTLILAGSNQETQMNWDLLQAVATWTCLVT